MKLGKFLSMIVVLALFLGASAFKSVEGKTKNDEAHEVRATLEPHGTSMCASGCSLSRHPTPTLERSRFLDLVKAYSHQEMTESSDALEELLFYGPQSEAFLRSEKALGLDSQRRNFLEEELARDTALLEFRLIDDKDQVRVSLPPTRVALDQRYVFEGLSTEDFQIPEASGTLKRVGLNHIWQRI